MAKLGFLLAVSHATLLYGLPTPEMKRELEPLDERDAVRAVTLSTDLEITTSYVSTIETFQSATVTEEPSLTGVCMAHPWLPDRFG
jgi:endo-1,3(4)-beta-glucanase